MTSLDVVCAEAELPSSSALLPADGVGNLECRSQHRSRSWLEEVVVQHSETCDQRVCNDVQQTEPDIDLQMLPKPQKCTGRRPRPTLADWGGGDLQQVLCHSRVRGKILFEASTSASSLHESSARRVQQTTPNLAAWGGSLGEVLVRRSASSTRHRTEEEERDFTHADRVERVSVSNHSLHILPPTIAASPSPNTGRRQRASAADWGGSLAEILRSAPPPTHRDTGGSDEDDRTGLLSAARANQSPFQDVTLSAVFPPRHHDTENHEPLERPRPSQLTSLAAARAARMGASSPWQQPKRRARSLVIRKGFNLPDCCSICLDDFKLHQRMTELPCKHCFHTICLHEYFAVAEKPSCPYCRADCSNLKV